MADFDPIGAVLSYAGVQDTNNQNEHNMQVTNAFNAAEAEKNRQWQQQMSDTSYQRQVKDLAAAGLNPMLGYMKGSGASTPSGGQASGVTFTAQNKLGSAVQAYNESRGVSAKSTHDLSSAAQADAQVKQVEATTDKIREEIKNLPKEGNRLDEEVNRLKKAAETLYQQGNLYFQQQGESAAKRDFYRESIKVLEKDGTLKGFEVEAIQKFDNFAKEYKQYAPIVDLIKSIFLPRSGGITINK